MADRIITVTDPSVVTNDTLAGYNNYSDIDGQLGTTMTPTEATNGHTVTLSDGVSHEVTTKPVGTTNGEFTAVVSNAVSVDLSGGGGTVLWENDFTSNISGLGAFQNGILTNPANQLQLEVANIYSGFELQEARNLMVAGTTYRIDIHCSSATFSADPKIVLKDTYTGGDNITTEYIYKGDVPTILSITWAYITGQLPTCYISTDTVAGDVLLMDQIIVYEL